MIKFLLQLIIPVLALTGCGSSGNDDGDNNNNGDGGNPGTTYEYVLVWSDEFDYEGAPDPDVWTFEEGFVRNEELQWYQKDNAVCEGGLLKVTAEKVFRPNDNYIPGSSDWRTSREHVEYTSSIIKTEGKKTFQYGRFEVKARIPVAPGAWPAIWTLGVDMEWPSNGEIDILEYYMYGGVPSILANVAWGTETRWQAKWNTQAYPFKDFTAKNPNWADEFHIWRMDWDSSAIRLYLDDELLNETLLENTVNGSLGGNRNPFKQPHYILLNLAVGGNGGTPDPEAYPITYEVEYVRVYQKQAVEQ